jgi:uncharacterized protein (TIGR02145 family)
LPLIGFGQGACNNQSSVTHQGYEYDIVEIGDQCWFSENCRYLPEVSFSAFSYTDPYYYVYAYGYNGKTDVAAAQATTSYETYGVLYNWPAVMTEGICPSGWHIPTDGEWQTMENSLGMHWGIAYQQGWRGAPVGDDMKATSEWGCNSETDGSSGWAGLPGGLHTLKTGPVGAPSYGHWWSASESASPNAWMRQLNHNLDEVFRGVSNRSAGFSARCVSDYSTTSSVPTAPSSNRKLEKVVDELGREVNHTTNQILFHIYDDGSVEKKFVVD